MSEQRNRHDQAIDVTLYALQGVEAPTGLEQRVLQTLAQRAASDSLPTKRFAWSAGLPDALRTRRFTLYAAACCLTVAAVAALPLGHPLGKDQPQRSGAQELTRRNASEDPNPSSMPPTAQPAVPLQLAQRPLPLLPAPPRPTARHTVSTPSPRQTGRPQSDTPPPVAPLTEQERLLQQIARSHKPNELAFLNPELVARQEAENDAEFRDFFASPQTRNP